MNSHNALANQLRVDARFYRQDLAATLGSRIPRYLRCHWATRLAELELRETRIRRGTRWVAVGHCGTRLSSRRHYFRTPRTSRCAPPGAFMDRIGGIADDRAVGGSAEPMELPQC